MENLLIRCSSLSKIANVKFGLTETQERDLQDLLIKIKLTEKQALKRDELIKKRDQEIDLTTGGKTYIESIVKQKIYNYEDYFWSKEVEKGNQLENDAINLLSLYRGEDYSKNEVLFKNEFIKGTPDIIHENKIIDIKCSWSKKTFPLNQEEAHNIDYEYQMRGYMMLTGCESAEVVYCLMSTPDELIGFEPLDIHKCDDLDLRLRFTSITYQRDLKIEKQIIEMVKKSRVYASQIMAKIENRFI